MSEISAYRDGVKLERERIIKLLEAEMCNAYGENCSNNPGCSARLAIIDLIKGSENVWAEIDNMSEGKNK